jgi:CheY-like chemotaxis protein
MKIEQPIHILLVEDNEGDIMLTQEAFEDANLLVEMSVVRDGKEAIDFMNKVGKYSNIELPDLVLLDIKLPKVSGLEVLSHIKENVSAKHIPVIMLTTSSYVKDQDQSKQSNANGYLVKPLAIDRFLKIISKLENVSVCEKLKFKLKSHSND